MRTKIDFFSSGVIDLADDVAYSINYAIADIREPDKRNSSYSKTIRIPGSKVNDRIFQHIWNIDIDCNFNPNRKVYCQLLIDDMPQLTGYLQLLRIYSLENKRIEYEVVIRGQVGNIFTVIGDAELTDLDFSEWNHKYLKSVQKASWTATVGEGYVYPLIDYGTGGIVYDVTNFYPAIYVKEYWDKIFASAGFTYSSNFLNTDFFKRLIIPNSTQGFNLSEEELALRNVSVDDVGYGGHPIASLNYTTNTNPNTTIAPFSHTVSDPSSQFSFVSNKCTILYSGGYNISYSSADYYCDHNVLASGFVSIIRERAGVFTSIAISYVFIRNSPANHGISGGAYFIAGDKIFIGYSIKLNVNTSILPVNLITYGDGRSSLSITASDITLDDDNDLNINNFIPKSIKQRDFLTSITKMFNLYFEVDKFVSNKINIEPRNDFYSSGVVVDWTSKLDNSQDLVLEPMGELNAGRYLYGYREDKDYWNQYYLKRHQQIYAEKNWFVDNDFLLGINKTEVIFSPTPQVQVASTDRNIPQILNVDNAGIIKETVSVNIRILYYGGVKTTGNAYSYTSVVEGDTTETTYPYCGMMDVPTNPTFTLDFGVPFELFYFTSVYTNNNLFNKYHRQFIEEITDKDSKIVTGWFALNPLDILKLDFRNEFFIDGHFLRLNKIYDYNPVISTLTKCEFIKIKRANQFVPERKGTGGWDNTFSDTTRPPKPIGGTLSQAQLGNIVVKDNYVGQTVRGAIVTGVRNSVGEGAKNITLLNSSGVVVFPNVNGATVINSSGVIVSDEGKLFINDIDLSNAPILSNEITLTAGAIDGANQTFEWGIKPTIIVLNGKILRVNVEYGLAYTGGIWKTFLYVPPFTGDLIWAY